MPYNPSRFQPKLIHPEQPEFDRDDDLQLPDDWAALADQLRDDAARLDERYAAADRSVTKPSAHANSLRIRCIAATAAACLGLGITLVYSGFLEPSGPVNSAFPVPHANEMHVDQASPSVYVGEVELPSQLDPALVLGSASAPEREGLLDLWEADSGQPTNIAF